MRNFKFKFKYPYNWNINQMDGNFTCVILAITFIFFYLIKKSFPKFFPRLARNILPQNLEICAMSRPMYI